MTAALRSIKGQSGTPTYSTWYGMHRRCSCKSDSGYKNYGGRGISVCERWGDMGVFVADMGSRPDGCTLDRIDNEGDYTPENCRWATRTQQARNTRKTVRVEHGGEVKALSDIAEETKTPYGLLYSRVVYGKRDISEATTAPEYGIRKRNQKDDCEPLECNLCGHVWKPRIDKPTACPRCKRYDWDK